MCHNLPFLALFSWTIWELTVFGFEGIPMLLSSEGHILYNYFNNFLKKAFHCLPILRDLF